MEKTKTRLIFRMLLLTIIISITVNILQAVAVLDHETKHTQPDGTVINYFISGDEIWRRAHNEKDFTMISDPFLEPDFQITMCWAIEDGKGGIISSGYPVHLYKPESLGIKPGIDISERRHEFLIRRFHSRPGLSFKTLILPDSTEIEVIIQSHRLYVYVSDERGYTMIYNENDNTWYWAVQGEDGLQKSSGYPVHLYCPIELGLQTGEFHSIERLEEFFLNDNHIDDEHETRFAPYSPHFGSVEKEYTHRSLLPQTPQAEFGGGGGVDGSIFFYQYNIPLGYLYEIGLKKSLVGQW